MPAKFIGMKNPDLKLEKLQSQVDTSQNTMIYSMSKNAMVQLKEHTPVDTGNMLKSWKKTPLATTFNVKSLLIYNTATNKRTGYPYPLALEYGFHHYAWGNYLGFRAGLFFRERTIINTKIKTNEYISVFNRGCMRVWK